MIIKEFIEWIETIMGFFPGKVGTLIRMIWYRFRWEKAAYVSCLLYTSDAADE